MAPYIRTGFFLSHSHKAQVRLVRAGVTAAWKTSQSFLPHKLLSLCPTSTHSKISKETRADRISIPERGGEEREKHPPSNTAVVERPLFDDNAFTLGTEGKRQIDGTVLPP